jgi:salicylate hydroxylase
VLDPEIQSIVDAVEAGRPAHLVPLDDLRTAQAVEALRLAGPGEEVAEVCEVDIPGPAGSVPVRVYRPKPDTKGPLPVVAYAHGGGWVMGTLDGFDTTCRALANAAGALIASIDYRLAPEHPFPAALEDVLAAYRSVLGARVVVTGECAGGGLAIALAVAARDEGLALPDAIDVVSPFCDLTLSGASIDAPAGPDPWMNRHRLRGMAASYIHGADPADPRISPLFADLRGLPPLTIRAAAGEALADDARRLAEAARAADVDVSLELVEDSVHSFVLFGFLPEAQAALSPR